MSYFRHAADVVLGFSRHQGLRILETRTAQIIQELGFMLDEGPAPGADGANGYGGNPYANGAHNGPNGW